MIESQGRAFPVETRYLGRDARARIEDQMADAVLRALRAEPGSVLAFLPGAAEIRRTETLLRERVSDRRSKSSRCSARSSSTTQDRAIAPTPPGRRKIVLATSIAETSLTIEGVRIVIDSGLARVPRYEPDVGLTRLETVRVSRAAADQRRGRAGRTEPGICYRLWDEPQTASLEALRAAGDPVRRSRRASCSTLPLGAWPIRRRSRSSIPPPKGGARRGARAAREFGALDGDGRITAEGQALRAPAAAAAARPHGGRRGARRRRRSRGRHRRGADRARARRQRRRSRATAWKISAATARAARATRAPWRSAGANSRTHSDSGAPPPPMWGRAGRGPRRAASSRSPIPTASRKTAAADASFTLANGRGGNVDSTSPWRARRSRGRLS